MPGPSTPQEQISSYLRGLQQDGQQPSFLTPYREFLLKLESLKTVTCIQNGRPEDFTFYVEAAEIPLDFLKHKDNLEPNSGKVGASCGKGVMNHLGELADKAAALPMGQERDRTLRILREVITELRYPCTTTQGAHGTCVAETISTQLLLFNPAEWTRLAVGLLKDSARSEIATSLPDKPLRLPADIREPDISPDRSLVAAYMQAAIKQSFAPPGWKYFNEHDKYEDENGKVKKSGMRIPEQVQARHALLGEDQVVKKTSEEWIKNPPQIGLYTVLQWSKNAKGHIETHAVSVTMYDARNDLVIFRNPHRQQDWKRDNDIIGDGPLRTSYDPELGLESMPLSAFMKRAEYSVLSRSELAAYEPPLAEVKAPPVAKWAKLRALGVGFAVTAAATGVGGTGYLGWTRYQLLTKGSPLNPIPSASAVDRDALFANEQNLFGPRQWKTTFGVEVVSEPYPVSLTSTLAAHQSPLSKRDLSVFRSHRLVLMPGNSEFEELQRIGQDLGVSFELGLSLGGVKIKDLPGLNSGRGAPSWVLLPRAEEIDPVVKQSFKGLSDFSKAHKLSQDFADYRTATVSETFLATLLAVHDKQHIEGFQVMCAGSFGGAPLCVGYDPKSKTFRVGTSSDFSFQELGVSMAHKLN